MSKHPIDKYTDMLISQYASNDPHCGLWLEACELSKAEQKSFMDFLFEKDDVTKELILDRIQELIEQRLPWMESQKKYDSGLTPRLDPVNGEVIWDNNKRGAA